MESLKSVFLTQIAQLYSAEMQQIQVFPIVIHNCYSLELASCIEQHLIQTRAQIYRLDKLGNILGYSFSSGLALAPNEIQRAKCPHMQMLIGQFAFIIDSAFESAAYKDAAILQICRGIEQFEIGAYTHAAIYANFLELPVLPLLAQSLEEERIAVKGLDDTLERFLLPQCEGDQFDFGILAHSIPEVLLAKGVQ